MDITDWIMLAAVIVALGIGVSSILQTQKLQKRERKGRLLNEVIEWAENTATLGHEDNIIKLPDSDEDGMVDEWDMVRISLETLSTVFARCQSIIVRSVYVEAVANEISNNLGDVVRQTISKLYALRKKLETSIKEHSDERIAIPRSSEFVELRQCAHCVIKLATIIKTSDGS